MLNHFQKKIKCLFIKERQKKLFGKGVEERKKLLQKKDMMNNDNVEHWYVSNNLQEGHLKLF